MYRDCLNCESSTKEEPSHTYFCEEVDEEFFTWDSHVIGSNCTKFKERN